MDSPLWNNNKAIVDTVLEYYWHNGVYRMGFTYPQDRYDIAVNQVRKIVRRVATHEWKRPWIAYQSGVRYAHLTITQKNYLAPLIAPLTLALGSGSPVLEYEKHSSWSYHARNEEGATLLNAYMDAIINDPYLRAVRRIPADVAPLSSEITP